MAHQATLPLQSAPAFPATRPLCWHSLTAAAAAAAIVGAESITLGDGTVWALDGLLALPEWLVLPLYGLAAVIGLVAAVWLFRKTYPIEWRLHRALSLPGEAGLEPAA